MMEGRIEGRNTGDVYEIRQGNTLLRSIPLKEARLDEKLSLAIRRNGWEPINVG